MTYAQGHFQVLKLGCLIHDLIPLVFNVMPRTTTTERCVMEEGITGSTKTRQRRVRPLFLDKEKGPGVVGTGRLQLSLISFFSSL